jgi:hypothetical protein
MQDVKEPKAGDFTGWWFMLVLFTGSGLGWVAAIGHTGYGNPVPFMAFTAAWTAVAGILVSSGETPTRAVLFGVYAAAIAALGIARAHGAALLPFWAAVGAAGLANVIWHPVEFRLRRRKWLRAVRMRSA